MLHTFKENLGKGRFLFWKSKHVIILTIIFGGRDKNIQFFVAYFFLKQRSIFSYRPPEVVLQVFPHSY